MIYLWWLIVIPYIIIGSFLGAFLYRRNSTGDDALDIVAGVFWPIAIVGFIIYWIAKIGIGAEKLLPSSRKEEREKSIAAHERAIYGKAIMGDKWDE